MYSVFTARINLKCLVATDKSIEKTKATTRRKQFKTAMSSICSKNVIIQYSYLYNTTVQLCTVQWSQKKLDQTVSQSSNCLTDQYQGSNLRILTNLKIIQKLAACTWLHFFLLEHGGYSRLSYETCLVGFCHNIQQSLWLLFGCFPHIIYSTIIWGIFLYVSKTSFMKHPAKNTHTTHSTVFLQVQ